MDTEPMFPKRHPVWTTFLTVAAFLIAVALPSGCGSDNDAGKAQQAVTVTVHDVAPSSVTPRAPRQAHMRVAHPKAKRVVHTMCDANIRVKTATTTCPFAQNVFLAYWTSHNYDVFGVSAYSPAAGRQFDLDCAPGQTIVCTAGDGAEVSFAKSAVDAYSLSQAKRYVATHDVGDNIFPWSDGADDTSSDAPSSDNTPVPLYTPEPDYSAPDTSPSPGENIPNYDNGRGYRVRCADGMYSQSGGIQGACSGHGGVG